jgi:2-polyprenyl-6-hydroxyphenyl methylase/3-demethylubiquinone-9 3-methyltransferase
MTGEPGVSLKDADTHFAFGRNWASYAGLIDDARIAEAERGLARLVGACGLSGKSFLDIGSGSGLHALAAARLGAERVVAIDLDPMAVDTTREVLGRHAAQVPAQARRLSVFELSPDTFGRCDVVYSWGVLHHTGAMREAIERAAQVVAPGGLFVFGLYRRTPLCGLWQREKRWYSRASPRAQRTARALYVGLLRLRMLLTGGDFRAFVAGYQSGRGMDFMHDVHDWMGGYPYESIAPEEVAALMRRLGFAEMRRFVSPPGLGLTGTGCDEYVYRRTDDGS